MARSDVAHFRQQQTQQEQAAQLGLTGLAMVSRHDLIEARASQGAKHLLQLLAQGKHEEVQAQMELPDWGLSLEEHSVNGKILYSK